MLLGCLLRRSRRAAFPQADIPSVSLKAENLETSHQDVGAFERVGVVRAQNF